MNVSLFKTKIWHLIAIFLLSLLVAPLFFKSNHISGEIFLSYNNKNFCKGAYVNGEIITASHCLGILNKFKITPVDKTLQIPTSLITQPLTKKDFLYSLPFNDKFTLPDISITNPDNITFGKCETQAITFYGKRCDLTKGNDGRYLSEQCHFPKGDSGTVMLDKNNNPCLVYSGYYDIIAPNKKIKIGVFKPLEIK